MEVKFLHSAVAHRRRFSWEEIELQPQTKPKITIKCKQILAHTKRCAVEGHQQIDGW